MEVREAQNGATARIVVGVDGSPNSQGALAWGLRAAAARGAVLVVVTAFPADVFWYDDDAADAAGVRVEAIRWEAARRTQELVANALAGLAVTGVEAPSITFVVVPGEPAERLLDHSRGAELLVLGSTDRDGAQRSLVGSVARHCVLTAPGHVLVVHPSPEMARDEADAALLERSRP